MSRKPLQVPNRVVSPEWLNQHLEEVKIIDFTFFFPTEKQDSYKNFLQARIPGALHMDIDYISDQHTTLPHMLAKPEVFAKMMGQEYGLKATDPIVIYDQKGLFSERVVDMATVLNNIKMKHSFYLDGRSKERFDGVAPEPRPGLPSGHMPGSLSVPYSSILNVDKKTKALRLKSPEELEKYFTKLGLNITKLQDKVEAKIPPIIVGCGSGVSAAIIWLALEQCGVDEDNITMYDASWSEYALPELRNPIKTVRSKKLRAKL